METNTASTQPLPQAATIPETPQTSTNTDPAAQPSMSNDTSKVSKRRSRVKGKVGERRNKKHLEKLQQNLGIPVSLQVDVPVVLEEEKKKPKKRARKTKREVEEDPVKDANAHVRMLFGGHDAEIDHQGKNQNESAQSNALSSAIQAAGLLTKTTPPQVMNTCSADTSHFVPDSEGFSQNTQSHVNLDAFFSDSDVTSIPNTQDMDVSLLQCTQEQNATNADQHIVAVMKASNFTGSDLGEGMSGLTQTPGTVDVQNIDESKMDTEEDNTGMRQSKRKALQKMKEEKSSETKLRSTSRRRSTSKDGEEAGPKPGVRSRKNSKDDIKASTSQTRKKSANIDEKPTDTPKIQGKEANLNSASKPRQSHRNLSGDRADKDLKTQNATSKRRSTSEETKKPRRVTTKQIEYQDSLDEFEASSPFAPPVLVQGKKTKSKSLKSLSPENLSDIEAELAKKKLKKKVPKKYTELDQDKESNKAVNHNEVTQPESRIHASFDEDSAAARNLEALASNSLVFDSQERLTDSETEEYSQSDTDVNRKIKEESNLNQVETEQEKATSIENGNHTDRDAHNVTESDLELYKTEDKMAKEISKSQEKNQGSQETSKSKTAVAEQSQETEKETETDLSKNREGNVKKATESQTQKENPETARERASTSAQIDIPERKESSSSTSENDSRKLDDTKHSIGYISSDTISDDTCDRIIAAVSSQTTTLDTVQESDEMTKGQETESFESTKENHERQCTEKEAASTRGGDESNETQNDAEKTDTSLQQNEVKGVVSEKACVVDVHEQSTEFINNNSKEESLNLTLEESHDAEPYRVDEQILDTNSNATPSSDGSRKKKKKKKDKKKDHVKSPKKKAKSRENCLSKSTSSETITVEGVALPKVGGSKAAGVNDDSVLYPLTQVPSTKKKKKKKDKEKDKEKKDKLKEKIKKTKKEKRKSKETDLFKAEATAPVIKQIPSNREKSLEKKKHKKKKTKRKSHDNEASTSKSVNKVTSPQKIQSAAKLSQNIQSVQESQLPSSSDSPQEIQHAPQSKAPSPSKSPQMQLTTETEPSSTPKSPPKNQLIKESKPQIMSPVFTSTPAVSQTPKANFNLLELDSTIDMTLASEQKQSGSPFTSLKTYLGRSKKKLSLDKDEMKTSSEKTPSVLDANKLDLLKTPEKKADSSNDLDVFSPVIEVTQKTEMQTPNSSSLESSMAESVKKYLESHKKKTLKPKKVLREQDKPVKTSLSALLQASQLEQSQMEKTGDTIDTEKENSTPRKRKNMEDAKEKMKRKRTLSLSEVSCCVILLRLQSPG